jgi:hypothetical protein
MQKFFLAFALIVPSLLRGQTFNDSDLQSLIDAERAFSKMAETHSTPEAFYEFLSDSAVTFGKDPRIGTNVYGHFLLG